MLTPLTTAVSDLRRLLLQQDEVITPPSDFGKSYFGFTGTAEPPLPRRALLVYIPYAFAAPPELAQHANVLTARMIAEALVARGYSVDIVHWSDPDAELREPYDLVVCLASANVRLLRRVSSLAPVIYFAASQYLPAQRRAWRTRVRRVYLRRRAYITRSVLHERPVNFPGGIALIVKGNQVTADTFSPLGLPVFPIDNIALPFPPPDLHSKPFAEARLNFLWLGSSPLLLKGLDLVLEAFAALPDLHLWVCGPIDAPAEAKFRQAYHRELFSLPNIHALGWVNLRSPEFTQLANRCAYLVYPSCSEGQSGAVLNAMAHGIIPIVSRDSGIDTDDFGVTLPDTRVSTIRRTVRDMAALPPEQCAAFASSAHQTATQRYTANNFRAKLEHILEQLVPVEAH